MDDNVQEMILGISVHYKEVRAVVMSVDGERIFSGSRSVARGDEPVPEAVKLVDSLLSGKKYTGFISGGISFPGTVDSSKRSVISSVYFPEFCRRPVAEEFETAFALDIPFFVERDAVCALISVSDKRPSGNKLLISLDPGVTAAVLLDGRILDGPSCGSLASLGHMPAEKGEKGLPCRCGKKGCIDTLVGTAAWEREFSRKPESSEKNQVFYESFEQGDAVAVRILTASLENLLPAIEKLVWVFSPESVIFSAPLPPSAALVLSTVLAKSDSIPGGIDIDLTDYYASASGAALLGYRISYDRNQGQNS